MRKILSLMALFVITLLSFSMVSALGSENLEWGTLKINGDIVEAGVDGEVLAVEEGETLNIRIGLRADSGAEDIEVEAKISGYEYSDYENLYDATHIDELQAGTTKYFNLEVELPNRLEKDTYWLRLRVLDKNSAAVEQLIKLSVEPTRHGVDIVEVSFSPYGNTIQAGRTLLASVLIENYGDRSEKDVRVTAAIPALGVSTTETIDLVSTDNHNVEFEDVDEMFLPIPASAAEGDYEVVVTVRYDDLRETATYRETIHVVADERFSEKDDTLVLAVGPELQNIATGKTAKYAVALTNAGPVAKAYVLETVTGSGLSASVTESVVVLEAGERNAHVVYVDVTAAKDATPGMQTVTLVIKSGSETLLTVPLKANVVEGVAQSATSGVSLRNGLEIALIVLVVLLVIIGLIIGFSRLRKDEDSEEEQTYY
jgi:uncharacterized membrane protein